MESLKGYWRRKDYERLDGSSRRHKKNRVQLGRNRKKKRFWRIKITPKFRFFRLSSPKKILIKIRDAYVSMMLSFANSAVFGGGFAFGAGDVGERALGFGVPALKEYDEKAIVEIYKSLVLQQQLMGNREEIVCRR